MKQAVHHWRAQRLTAIILIPLCLWFIFTLAGMTAVDHAAVSAWIKSPLNSLLLILFTLALFYHAQLGLQVVVEDYVGNDSLRNCTILICSIAMSGAGLISILAVLKISLGL
jgi:succinate dehydrogenase / fumarate reductase membrane anchor subunit